MSLSATERDEKNNPKPVFRQRIIMPVDAFANAVDLMQKALGGLVEAGAVRRISRCAEAAGSRGGAARPTRHRRRDVRRTRRRTSTDRQIAHSASETYHEHTTRTPASIAWPWSRVITASIFRPSGWCTTMRSANKPVATRQLLRMAKDAGLRARQATAFVAVACSSLATPIRCLPNSKTATGWSSPAPRPAATARRWSGFSTRSPQRPELLLLTEEQFAKSWRGSVVLLKRNYRISDADQPFGFRWFVPELLRQRSLFRDVAIAAFVLYGLGLAMPIFFQLVIDKVLVHESYATLTVLTIGIAIALVFDAVFTFLRRYLLLYATNKIDIRVATRTFGHLLNLPIALFEQASAGVLVKHMQQTSRIREFLTGRLFLTLLDGAFAAGLRAGPAALQRQADACGARLRRPRRPRRHGCSIGPFRRRLQALYQAEGERQALLVETVHGMRTVKSLALGAAAAPGLGRPLRAVDLRALPGREDLGRRPVAHRPAREADERRHHRARRAGRLQRQR